MTVTAIATGRSAIDLVDDEHIHPALPHLGEQKLRGWTGQTTPNCFFCLAQLCGSVLVSAFREEVLNVAIAEREPGKQPH